MKENKFAERLSDLMLDNGITVLRLSKEIGVSDEIVRLWKNGESSILLSKLIKLADYFNCSLEFLVGRTEVVLDYKVCSVSDFYQRLRSVMAEKGVSRYSMVNALPIYDSYFTNWKNGKSPNLITLLQIADYLDVSVDYLIGREQ